MQISHCRDLVGSTLATPRVLKCDLHKEGATLPLFFTPVPNRSHAGAFTLY
jgi:hypothetical protein